MKDNGVNWYLRAELKKEIFFPNGDVRCCNCRLCRRYQSHMTCSQTGEEVTSIYYQGIGNDCPLEFDKEGKDGNQTAQSE